MSKIDIRTALERLIAGDLRAEEAITLATSAGYRTFADLCENELPERLPGIRIERTMVRKRVAQAITGRLPLSELRGWAEELAAVLDRHELGVSVLERRRLSEALALVAVATDVRIFKNTQPVLRVLSSIVRSLGRRRPGQIATLYGQLFFNQPEFHLLTRRLEDVASGPSLPEEHEPQGPPTYLPQVPSFLGDLGLEELNLDSGLDSQWSSKPPEMPEGDTPAGVRCADVVALNRPYTEGTRVQDYEWVVAFSVATCSLVREDTVPGVTEDGFLDRARELAPNFEFDTYKPEARRDQDGVLEIVLKADIIGRRELIYAAKLFARGPEKCAEKFGEEAIEAIIAAAKGDKKNLTEEAADVLFHLLVMLSSRGVRYDDVLDELRRREGVSGIVEKASRGKG